MAMGMSPSEFWDGDVSLCSAYREAQRIKDRHVNTVCWQMGAYVYDALLRASPAFNGLTKAKVMPYPDRPYGTEDEVDAERRDMRKRESAGLAWMRSFASKHNARFSETRQAE